MERKLRVYHKQLMLLRGGSILRTMGRVERADILVRDGRVAAIGTFDTAGHELVDVANGLVIPGLVNAHYHSNENFLAGSFDNLTLEAWMLDAYPVLAAPVQTPREIYSRTLLGCRELLRNGVTTVLDFLIERPLLTCDAVDAACQAYVDSGIRACVVLGMADKAYLDTIPLHLADIPEELRADLQTAGRRTAAQAVEFASDIVRTWDNRAGRLRIGLGPSSPQRCSGAFLQALHGFARDANVPLQLHVLESRLQYAADPMYFGGSSVYALDQLGVRGPGVSIAHGVWLSADDMHRLANAGTAVVHCPVSNLKLGSGIAPLTRMLASGLRLGLGTDGRASNDRLDVFEVAKAASLLTKVQEAQTTGWPEARHVWELATAAGARIAGCADHSAVVEAGMVADLVVLDLSHPDLVPLNDPMCQLIYCAPSRAVRTVLVSGQVVLDHGRLLTCDEQALVQEAGAHAAAVRARSVNAASIAAQLRPAIQAAYTRAGLSARAAGSSCC